MTASNHTPAREDLHPRQQRILDFIQTFIHDQGYAPTVREIAQASGISSTSVVNYHLDKLERQRFIARQPRLSRSISVHDPHAPGPLTPHPVRYGLLDIPLLRDVLRLPISRMPDTGQQYSVPAAWLGTSPAREVYAVAISPRLARGNALLTGDVVILRRTYVAQTADRVLLVHSDTDSLRLGRITYHGSLVHLGPLMPGGQARMLYADDIQIIGHLLRLVRKF